MQAIQVLMLLAVCSVASSAFAFKQCGEYRLQGKISEVKAGKFTFQTWDLEGASVDIIVAMKPEQEIQVFSLRNSDVAAKIKIQKIRSARVAEGTALTLSSGMPPRIGAKPDEVSVLEKKVACAK